MSRKPWRARRWLIGATLLIGVAGLLWFARWLVTMPAGDPLSTADQRSSVINAATGLIGLALTAASIVLARRPFGVDPATALESAAERLAQRLRVAYQREAQNRQLHLLGPLKVRWEPAAARVTSKASQSIPGSGGDLDELAAAFTRLNPEQLVITGDPASGKSSMALQLALAMLDDQGTGGPQRVPVLMSATSWRPREQSLTDWLIARLVEEHPELTRSEYGKQAPRDLVEQGRVLLILDAFDELSEGLHDKARAGVVEATANGRPFILAMRTEAYLKAVRAQGKAFGRAAVVRLRPLTTEQVIAALTADDIGEVRQRWKPVRKRMEDPGSPLARALSSPLMVYLARLAYGPGDTDPAQLTRLKRDRDIVRHLFDSYLPAVYRGHAAPPRVRKWLSLLARHLETSEQSTDLAWWRLHLMVPRSGLVVTFAVGVVANYLFYRQLGVLGFLAGFAAMAMSRGLMEGRPPRRLRLRALGPQRILVAAVLGFGLGLALVPIIEPGHGTWFVVFSVSMVGVVASVLVGLLLSPHTSDAPDTTEPRAMLANDRLALLGIVTIVGLASGVRSAVQYDMTRGLLDACQIMLLFALLASVGLRFGPGWLTFGIARTALRLRHGFPWQLLAFLEDAHRRGVLRRSGPFYQFRHADLQRYLITEHSASDT